MKQYSAGLLVVLFCHLLAARAEYTEEDDVLILNEDNFDKAIKEFNNILVEFYAPWCGHCKELAPEYAKAAKKLKEEGSSIRLAKVDAIEEKEIAERFEVKSYPVLKFFRDGVPVSYNFDNQAEGIVQWLKKKTGVAADEVNSAVDVKILTDKHYVVVLGLFKSQDSDAGKVFLKVADSLDDIPFAMSHNADLLSEYKVDKDTVLLLTQFDDGRIVHTGDITEDLLTTFVEVYRLPSIIEFNGDTAPKVFERKLRKHVILFVDKDADYFEGKLEEYKKAAQDFRGKAIFIYVNAADDEYKRILEWFHLNKTDCPTLRFIDLEGPQVYKQAKPDWTVDELKQFIRETLDGKTKPFYISEEIPEDWDARPVKILVGKNFEEVVYDKTKDVFVEFYAPWCGFCKELAPVWDELGDKFKKSDTVIIAKIDGTANQFADIKIPMFPTLKFFAKDSNEVIDFPSLANKTLENLVKFVNLGGHLPDEGLKLDLNDLPTKEEL